MMHKNTHFRYQIQNP